MDEGAAGGEQGRSRSWKRRVALPVTPGLWPSDIQSGLPMLQFVALGYYGSPRRLARAFDAVGDVHGAIGRNAELPFGRCLSLHCW